MAIGDCRQSSSRNATFSCDHCDAARWGSGTSRATSRRLSLARGHGKSSSRHGRSPSRSVRSAPRHGTSPSRHDENAIEVRIFEPRRDWIPAEEARCAIAEREDRRRGAQDRDRGKTNRRRGTAKLPPRLKSLEVRREKSSPRHVRTLLAATNEQTWGAMRSARQLRCLRSWSPKRPAAALHSPSPCHALLA